MTSSTRDTASQDEVVDELNRLRRRATAAQVDLRYAVLRAIAGGMSEVAAARAAGIDRMTVRRLLGKQRRQSPEPT